jgi:predicted  nucleic acid-binding Zn-ribbon protein
VDKQYIEQQIQQLEQGLRSAKAQLAEAEEQAKSLQEAIDLNRGAILAYRQMLEREAAEREEPPEEA